MFPICHLTRKTNQMRQRPEERLKERQSLWKKVQFRKEVGKWDTCIIHGPWWDSPRSPIGSGWCHWKATLDELWLIMTDGREVLKDWRVLHFIFCTFLFSELFGEEYTGHNLFAAIGMLKEEIFRINIMCLDSSTSIHLYA